MSTWSRNLVAALACALLLVASAPAQAHPDLEAGKRLTGELEFESALAAFERALDSGSLTREELVELLAERSLLLHALHRQRDLIENLVWLSALDPDHRLDLRAPPELTQLWASVRDQGRGALTVTLSARANARSELDAKASLGGTVPKGARARLVLRSPDGKWRIVESAELSEALPQRGLELYAEAIGLGSVAIARDHGPARPLRVSAVDAALAANAGPALEASQPSGGWARRYRGVLIGSAVAALAVAAVAVVLLTRPEDGGEAKRSDSTILKPMVSF